ncbi:MAG: NTP transferase domain-containing protein [Bacteroidetes bacterium]|nr:NTP transferase domain-containing protein [Bacteroidota bacterium]
MEKLSIVILAAGSSSRLGQPKQLLKLGKKTLLAHICETALSIENQGVVVVLGAHCEAIKPTIEHLPVQLVFNEKWADGMGGSVSCGIANLPAEADGVLLLLCDQPFVSAAFLKNLVDRWRSTNSLIFASQYGSSFGPPAIFSKKLFPELTTLTGQQGAKKLMLSHQSEMALIDFPEGEKDIDIPADLALLRRITS